MTIQESIEIIQNTPIYRYESDKTRRSDLGGALHMAVDALQKYEKNKQQWIPVSERLPECEWGFETNQLLFQVESSQIIHTGYYGCGGKYRDRYFRTLTDAGDGYDASSIIAWMPLPEPYNEGECDD